MVGIKSDINPDQPSILDHIEIDLNNEHDYDKDVLSFKDPVRDIVFSHDFIAQKEQKYNLSFDGCGNC